MPSDSSPEHFGRLQRSVDHPTLFPIVQGGDHVLGQRISFAGFDQLILIPGAGL
jgi:hypothetical protein